MGTKGTQTSQTNQTQNYTPTGANYLTNALNQGQSAASLPFNIPQAPVAGFSNMQNQGFAGINAAQGQANPYYQQAQGLYNQAAQQPNVANFYNPMASAVNSQLQNTFGEQASQNTGSLTQAAGGVGADRIAVGQADLANQQGLAQGSVDASLYQQATTAAQAQQTQQMNAGTNLANLGTTAQNTALAGANSQLTAGGQQQALQQQQLNSPYNLALAEAAFPYEQAQFGAGIAGSLAPSLGGTTTGQGNTTSQYNPSLTGQIAGGATAGVGFLAALGLARGGAVGGNPFASGGATVNPYASLDGGVSGQPIDISKGYIPTGGNLPAGQSHQASLNLNAPTGSTPGSSGTSGLSGAMNSLISQAANLGGTPGSQVGGLTFGPTSLGGAGGPTPLAGTGSFGGIFNSRGGAVAGGNVHHHFVHHGHHMGAVMGGGNPYADGGTVNPFPGSGFKHPPVGYQMPPTHADGGTVSDDDRTAATDALRQKMTDPFSAAGPSADSNPFRTDAAADDAWRNSTPLPGSSVPLPQPRPAAADAPVVASDDDDVKVTATGADATVAPGPYGTYAQRQANAAAPDNGPQASPSFGNGSMNAFLGRAMSSPGAALMAGGLDAMRTGSMASGMGTSMKLFGEQQHESDTVAQAAAKLKQEADFHRDEYTKLTAAQQAAQDKAPTGYETTDNGMRAIPGGPADPSVVTALTKAKAKDQDDTTVKDIVQGMKDGTIPPSTTGLYSKGAAVRAEAARQNFNLTQAGLQYSAAQKQVTTLNGPQTTRLVGLSKSVDNTIDEVNALGEQLHNSGIPLLNQIKLQALVNTEGNSPRGRLATRYLTAVNTVKEEFANAANGGYAPTDAAWNLANQQINGNYGEQQLKDSLSEVQRLIRYRVNAIPNINTLGPNAANRYTGQTGAPAAGAAPAAAAPSFTGRTASGPGGAKLRETSDGKWVP